MDVSELLHKRSCTFLMGSSKSKTCDCGIFEAYLKRPGLQDVSIRDYLAGMALNGMLSRDSYQGGWCPNKEEAKCGVKRVSRFAYEYADAMLKAREKKETNGITEDPHR